MSEAPRDLPGCVRRLRRLRRVGWLEGVSFVVLVFVGMPLKYGADAPLLVQISGPIHGVLFLAMCVVVADTWWGCRWSIWRALAMVVLALLPFGPFFADPRLRRDEAAAQAGSAGEEGEQLA